MELTGYDITLEPTGLHKITLDCIGNDNDIETIRRVYNTGIWQGIGLSRSWERILGCAKENKNMTTTELRIKKVIFNDPATIVFWADGTKTVAKAHGDDKFDKEIGLTVCIAKKALGNRSNFDKVFKKWIK